MPTTIFLSSAVISIADPFSTSSCPTIFTSSSYAGELSLNWLQLSLVIGSSDCAAKEGEETPARTAVRKELKAAPLTNRLAPPQQVFFYVTIS